MLTATIATQKNLLDLFEKTLAQQTFMQKNKPLYEAVRHIMQLKGKRFRPLLLLQANDLFFGNIKEALPAALAIEVFHNFSLVHDDIMDEAALRRGKPTVHKTYGTNNAIIAGDMMLCHAYELLSRSSQEVLSQLLDVFNKAAIAIMEGQHLDMEFETRSEITEEEYLDMIWKKTSVLLAASLQMGAILANTTEKDQKAIYNFGRNLGLMFQIKDDLLDTYGSQQVGKRIGGDIIQNKKTYLLVSAMNLANADQQQSINATLELKDEAQKILQMKKLYEETGAKEQAEQKMNFYFLQSVEAMENIAIEKERKLQLLNFAESIYFRDY